MPAKMEFQIINCSAFLAFSLHLYHHEIPNEGELKNRNTAWNLMQGINGKIHFIPLNSTFEKKKNEIHRLSIPTVPNAANKQLAVCVKCTVCRIKGIAVINETKFIACQNGGPTIFIN